LFLGVFFSFALAVTDRTRSVLAGAGVVLNVHMLLLVLLDGGRCRGSAMSFSIHVILPFAIVTRVPRIGVDGDDAAGWATLNMYMSAIMLLGFGNVFQTKGGSACISVCEVRNVHLEQVLLHVANRKTKNKYAHSPTNQS
jgi:hypothetical protein